jgi:hypothetical protein
MESNLLNVNREEYKYFVNKADLPYIRSFLNFFMFADEHSKNSENSYLVTSLYFDTILNNDLDEKLDGILNREKYRLRIYDNCFDVIKLESKKKAGTVIQKKSRAVTKINAEKISSGKYEDLLNSGDDFFLKSYLKLKGGGYVPRVIVEYDREAYTLPYNDIRITIDKNLRTYGAVIDFMNVSSYPCVKVFDEDYQIIEVKFRDFLPENILDFFSRISVTRSSISKFALCQKYTDIGLWRDELISPF